MMKVKLIAHTPNPEKVVAAAAKLCYSNAQIDTLLDGLTEEKSKEFVEMLASLGHESPTEHASFTFAIEGVSRSLLAQITRHRIASYSVQSQRYVNLKEPDFVTPPEIMDDPESLAQFNDSMAMAAENYQKVTQLLKEAHKEKFMAQGMDEKTANRTAEKKALEDARFILPNACTTKMIVTMNTRSLNNFFRHRCCTRAQWEIRELADEMLKLVCEVAPALFVRSGPPCVSGPCPEGKMSCGRMLEMRDKYAQLKNAKVGE
ncbi:MAG: FAD-dependent thymidylate synthase [Oscillospiraceae bacterium]|nr:FAD-dependent thymidylate synthase [Oscillospiraceae bacterium]